MTEPPSPGRLGSAGPLLPVLEGYDHFELIAHGSTALVFRAIQTRLDRPVAIKVITVDTESQPVNTERELATTVALSSQPHIVSIIDTGQTPDNRPYIVMEYCEGGSYGQILRDSGPLPVDDVVEVGVKIGEALDAAHQSGIIHRDVKPSNILRSRFGPALTDFGIARASDELSCTLTREMLTPYYASPEALMHQNQTGLSDVYSLASTMWTLLAGRPPFADSTKPLKDMQRLAHRVLHEPLPAMPRTDVPPWLVTELTRAMSKRPSERHASALEFTQALRRGALGLAPTATRMASRTAPGTRRLPLPITLPLPRRRARGIGGLARRTGFLGVHRFPSRGRRQRLLFLSSLAIAVLAAGGFTATQLINDHSQVPDEATMLAPGGRPAMGAVASTPAESNTGSTPAASESASLEPASSVPATQTSSSSAGTLVTGPAAGLVVRVVSKASGLTMAVSDGSTSNGALIVQSASTGPAARWRLVSAGSGCYQLLNVQSGLALDNPDGTLADGTRMQQWRAAAGSGNQIWCFQAVGGGWYSIRNQVSGSLLDLRDGSKVDGAAIQQWGADPLAPNANQSWQLQAVS